MKMTKKEAEQRREDRSRAQEDDWSECVQPINGMRTTLQEQLAAGASTSGRLGTLGSRYACGRCGKEEWSGVDHACPGKITMEQLIDDQMRREMQAVEKTTARRGPDLEAIRRDQVSAIRNRIAQKREEYAEYLAHAKIRLREEDLHGLWDCGANASEVSNYIDGLVYALEALGEKP